MISRALWITAPGVATILESTRLDPADIDAVEIRTSFSGISRGTEALVLYGGVPSDEWSRMRCPFQGGDFSFPVKYGYAAVGTVLEGPDELRDRDVFVLHPHQDRFHAPAAMAIPLPEGLPAARAVLAANMETALNIIWDAGAAPGDRIAVFGAGLVGTLVGWLGARLPGAHVTLVDVNPGRAALAAALGCTFAQPDDAPRDCDVVINASASSDGLTGAIAAAGFEARIVEASWHGTRTVPLMLGGAFHSQRLQLVSSQVGQVPAAWRARWSRRRRLETALALLTDPALDVLISGETPFDSIAGSYRSILDNPDTLCHRIRYL